MSECISCHSSGADYPFKVIEIQTLHIRDIGGEKYVQAMGGVSDHTVCKACADKYRKSTGVFSISTLKGMLPFALLIVFGILYTIFQKSDILYIRLLGVFAVLCGLIGILTKFRTFRDRKQAFAGYSKEEALHQAAWLILIDSLPKKNNDQDITYIPVNKKTKKMSEKELSAAYDLLPAIAKQVRQRIKTL